MLALIVVFFFAEKIGYFLLASDSYLVHTKWFVWMLYL